MISRLKCSCGRCVDYGSSCDICRKSDNITEEFMCMQCGLFFDRDDLTYGLCDACIKDSFTVETAKEYLSDENLEKKFYVEYFMDSGIKRASEDLVKICKAEFNKRLNSPFMYKREETEKLLRDFCFDDVSDYACWYADKLKERYKAQQKIAG